jgi:hypothetical protein
VGQAAQAMQRLAGDEQFLSIADKSVAAGGLWVFALAGAGEGSGSGSGLGSETGLGSGRRTGWKTAARPAQ